jgi:hypothetical protein
VAGATVGTVKAKDNDIGRNAKVFYSVRNFQTSDVKKLFKKLICIRIGETNHQ